jgi:hypothetical protein
MSFSVKSTTTKLLSSHPYKMDAYEVHCVPIQYYTIEEGGKRNRRWWGNLKANDCFKDFAVDRNITLKWILKIKHRWIGLIWLRKGASGELL